MIKVKLCRLEDLDDGAARRVEADGAALCLVRIGDTVRAIGDLCSHEDYSLSEGEVDRDECAIECSKHGSLFSLLTGEPLTLPATRPVPVYDVAVEDGDVVLLDDPPSAAS